MGERIPLAQGREAEVFLEPNGTVLKLMRDPSHQWRVDREAAALAALAVDGIAAPEVLGVIAVDGRPGLVMSRLDGDDLLTRLGRWPLSVLKAGKVLGRAHAAMHKVIAPTSLPELNQDLRARIQAAEPLPAELKSRTLEILDTLPQGDRLCHGDLHLGNLIGSWSNPAIIDWGDASRGDPVADVARTELLQRLGSPPPGAPMLIRTLAPIGGDALAVRYLAAYRRQRPVPGAELTRWRIVRAAARLCEPIPSEHPRLLRYLRHQLR
jgi:aminoglycoside phosphotransferase (APT) family kinase protein